MILDASCLLVDDCSLPIHKSPIGSFTRLTSQSSPSRPGITTDTIGLVFASPSVAVDQIHPQAEPCACTDALEASDLSLSIWPAAWLRPNPVVRHEDMTRCDKPASTLSDACEACASTSQEQAGWPGWWHLRQDKLVAICEQGHVKKHAR